MRGEDDGEPDRRDERMQDDPRREPGDREHPSAAATVDRARDAYSQRRTGDNDDQSRRDGGFRSGHRFTPSC